MVTSLQDRIKTMPRVLFVCGRDWMVGPDHFELGVLWGKDRNAAPCERVYRKHVLLRWSFRFRLDARLRR